MKMAKELEVRVAVTTDKSSCFFYRDSLSNEAFTEYVCLYSPQKSDPRGKNEYLVANEKLNPFLAFLGFFGDSFSCK